MLSKKLKNLCMAVFSAMILILVSCTSITFTNRNATGPVMAGKFDHIGAKDTKNIAPPQLIMAPANAWSFIFLLVAYRWSATPDDAQGLADAEYATTVEQTRCTQRVQSAEYTTYSHFSLIYTAYMNKIGVFSGGGVKCVR